MSENNVDRRTATQRIEDLERVLTSVYTATSRLISEAESLAATVGSLQADMSLVKDALKLINRRVEAVVQSAAPETGITSDKVDSKVLDMNVADLKAQIQAYLDNGHLMPADTVTKDTFLVCEELDSEGKTANPRIQFRLDSQDEATQEKLMGMKVGDTVSFEGKLSAKLLEVYTIVPPKTEEAPQAEAPQAEGAISAEMSAETQAPEVQPEQAQSSESTQNEAVTA